MPSKPISPKPDDSSDANNAGALSKSLDVLEIIMNSAYPPSAAHITEELKLPRPTTNRIIGNLVRLNFLKRDVKQRQLIEGDRLLKLALNVIARATQRGPTHEILRELSSTAQETCNVGAIASGRIRYIDRVEAHWPLSLRLEPGSEVPLHCTAIGKLLLSNLPLPQREKYLKTMNLVHYTENTITDLATLEAGLDVIAKQGFSIDNEEHLPGVLGLAVPIPNADGFPVLGLAIAVPSARVNLKNLQSLLPLLRQYANKLAMCY